MTNNEFEGKVALVTGATSGIGRATAVAFAEAGANVIAAGRRERRGHELEGETSGLLGSVAFVQADVMVADDVKRMVSAAIEKFGRLDYAFNNAGAAPGGDTESARTTRLHEYSDEHWDWMSDMFLKSVWRCMKHEIEVMLPTGTGVIVNNASVAGLRGGGAASYVTMKHGVVGLTKSATRQYAGEGMRFNAVCPGWIDTELTAGWTEDPDISESFLSRQSVKHPGESEEVASLVKWLCSDSAGFVDGVAWPIDGGLTA